MRWCIVVMECMNVHAEGVLLMRIAWCSVLVACECVSHVYNVIVYYERFITRYIVDE